MGRAISGKPRPLYLQPSHTGMVFSTTVDDGRPIRECDVSHYVFQIVNVRIKINEAVKEARSPAFFPREAPHPSVPPSSSFQMCRHQNLEQEPIFSLQTYNFSKDIHLF